MPIKTKEWFKISFLKLAAALKEGDQRQIEHLLHDIEEELGEEDIIMIAGLKAVIKSTIKKLRQNINNKNACYAIIRNIIKKLS